MTTTAGAPARSGRRVLVVVGTDHHPFGRVVEWTDDWASHQPSSTEVVVQHGSAPPPVRARGHALLPRHELHDLMARASVVVTHGGPATIMDVRRAGLIPLVVPRDPTLGEHVDAHQQLFSRRMARAGLVRLCESRAQLGRELDMALSDPSALSVSSESDIARVADSVDRVRAVLDALVKPDRSLPPV